MTWKLNFNPLILNTIGLKLGEYFTLYPWFWFSLDSFSNSFQAFSALTHFFVFTKVQQKLILANVKENFNS